MTEKEALLCNTTSTELAVGTGPPPPAEQTLRLTLCHGTPLTSTGHQRFSQVKPYHSSPEQQLTARL